MKRDRNSALLSMEIKGISKPRQGKVRDVYDVGDKLLIVATDRISAFDVVMPNGIPDKGRILTGLSLFWFELLKHVPNHLITADVKKFPSPFDKYAESLEGRSMLVKKAKVLPVECIVRGYLVGSGWKDYIKSGCVCGIKLRSGYRQAEKLDEPLFTPSTKAEQGEHDQNISFEETCKTIGEEKAQIIKKLSLEAYSRAADYAISKGIILADTKFEFGELDGRIILVDEVLTPDSSRFWPADQYKIGSNPSSLDKQFVRDYLEGLNWDKTPPAPELPDDVVFKTRDKYIDALKRITGKEFDLKSKS